MWGKSEAKTDDFAVPGRVYRPTQGRGSFRKVVFSIKEAGNVMVVFYERDDGTRTYCTSGEWIAWLQEAKPTHFA